MSNVMPESKTNSLKNIFVNATAAQHGGALTIIRQFLEAFTDQPLPGIKLYVFCTTPLSFSASNSIEFILFPRKNFAKRLYWDYIGMKKWSRAQGIIPSLILSFQNTGVSFPKIPQVIYIHNAIPFSAATWNIADKEQRTFWFYKNVYPFFIKKTLSSRTWLVVQTQWMKKKVADKFNFPEDKITVARPSFLLPRTAAVEREPRITSFFYPATPLVFKNHIEIIAAFSELKNKVAELHAKVYLTCEENELPEKAQRMLREPGLKDYFVFLGRVSFEEILHYYNKADVLLFPSKIETVGLPLLEASASGMPVIAADEPYAQEILSGYQNVKFVATDNTPAWTKAIQEALGKAVREKGFIPASEDGWIKVLSLLESIVYSAG